MGNDEIINDFVQPDTPTAEKFRLAVLILNPAFVCHSRHKGRALGFMRCCAEDKALMDHLKFMDARDLWGDEFNHLFRGHRISGGWFGFLRAWRL